MSREQIKDFYGKILGSIETTNNGDKIARDFYGKILGKYVKNINKTLDFYGKVLSNGDITPSLIWSSKQ